ncbi:MAG: glycosyl hydrolase 115 family protein [Prevotellaceae bacterium]|nr:glycosyl hydrolase 115 family protein [Prevotellaceae bacterium]
MKKTNIIRIFLVGLILSTSVAFGATHASGLELTGDTPWLISEEQPEALERALNDVQSDWYKVFGQIPVIVKELPDSYTGAVIYLGLKGSWRNDLINEPLSEWESYILRVQKDDKGRMALVVTGADIRGSIYAAYSLSEELLGVDPWYFWTDNDPAIRERIAVPAGFDKSHGSPTFKYRGWFMNDEDLLSMFAPDPVRENVFSLSISEKIYETILRLKGNMTAPATFPFPDERCQELAARRGLVINMHHILVLGLNTYRWPKDVPFSYSKDPGIMERYWQQCIDAFKDYETVWTVGYRGKYDNPFWNNEPDLKTPEERGAVITKAIAKQVEMIRRKHPVADIIANLWMEGSELYQKGFLKLPEGVTIVWADNGAGFITDKPQVNVWNNQIAPDEEGRVRKGDGIYYHTAMLNGRANQLSEMVPPARIYHEVLRFVKAGATMFFLDNVSDIRPVPMTTDCAMKLVWDATPYLNRSDEENQANFLNDWSHRQFGAKIAGKAAANYAEYFHIPYIFEQESDHGLSSRINQVTRVTASAVAENKPLSEKALKTIQEQLKFAVDNRVYVDKLSSKATALASQIPAGRKDFYQSHVLTQLLIHQQALVALEYGCRSALAYQPDNRTQAISFLDKAIQACKEMFAGRQKAEYGKWTAWYRGDSFIGYVHSYDQLRILNAHLKNEPAPPVREKRGYKEIEQYQERFKDNFPLLYPEQLIKK